MNGFVYAQKPEIKEMSDLCATQNLFGKEFSAFVGTQKLLNKKIIASAWHKRTKFEKICLLCMHKTTKWMELDHLLKHKSHSQKKISSKWWIQSPFSWKISFSSKCRRTRSYYNSLILLIPEHLTSSRYIARTYEKYWLTLKRQSYIIIVFKKKAVHLFGKIYVQFKTIFFLHSLYNAGRDYFIF